MWWKFTANRHFMSLMKELDYQQEGSLRTKVRPNFGKRWSNSGFRYTLVYRTVSLLINEATLVHHLSTWPTSLVWTSSTPVMNHIIFLVSVKDTISPYAKHNENYSSHIRKRTPRLHSPSQPRKRNRSLAVKALHHLPWYFCEFLLL